MHRSITRAPLVLAIAMAAAALPVQATDTSITTDSPTCALTAYRVRADFEAALDADRDWAGAVNENVTVTVDTPLRIRMELETRDGNTPLRRFWLQYRRNGGAWQDMPAADHPYPLGNTPPVSVVMNEEYGLEEPTGDLLAGSDLPFQAGVGIVGQATTPSWRGGAHHGEWEWPIVIRRFSDNAVFNEDGDTFELRMADTSGACTGRMPNLTLAVPAGHLGGTFVETPGPIGPWQASNGDLYFTIEPSETTNMMMMVKSSDGGRSWREVDGAHRPRTGDLEGVAAAFAGDTVHVLHQTSDDVWHHAFHTSDHPTRPDTWAIRDARLASPMEPPTQVAALAARTDGSLVAIYGGPEQIHVRIRSTQGQWSEETIIDADTGPRLSGPMAVRGAGDAVHLAYTGHDGTAWYRKLGADGTPGPREQISGAMGRSSSDVGAVLPLVYLPDSDTVVIVYRTADGRLFERSSVAGAPLGAEVLVTDRIVLQNAVDADQTAADAIALDGTAHVIFIEKDSGHLHHTHRDRSGRWHPATRQQGDVEAQWVRGRAVRRADGTQVYGYVFDAGSNGGSGENRYGEVAPQRAP